jgi:hypothetical protein
VTESIGLKDGRVVNIERTSLHTLVGGGYDPEANTIYISSWALKYPKLYDHILRHEIRHAEIGSNLLAHLKHDLHADYFERETQALVIATHLRETHHDKVSWWQVRIRALNTLRGAIAFPIMLWIMIRQAGMYDEVKE